MFDQKEKKNREEKKRNRSSAVEMDKKIKKKSFEGREDHLIVSDLIIISMHHHKGDNFLTYCRAYVVQLNGMHVFRPLYLKYKRVKKKEDWIANPLSNKQKYKNSKLNNQTSDKLSISITSILRLLQTAAFLPNKAFFLFSVE